MTLPLQSLNTRKKLTLTPHLNNLPLLRQYHPPLRLDLQKLRIHFQLYSNKYTSNKTANNLCGLRIIIVELKITPVKFIDELSNSIILMYNNEFIYKKIAEINQISSI